MLTSATRKMIETVWKDPTRVTRDWERMLRIFTRAGLTERRVRTLLSSGPILDSGCGSGSIVVDLLKRGFDAYGFDIAFFDAERKKKAISDQPDLPGLHERLIAADATNLPYPDARFQTILSLFGALAYARSSNEARGILEESLRVLKSKGQLIIVPVDLRPNGSLFWLACDNASEVEGYIKEESSIFTRETSRIFRDLVKAKRIQAQAHCSGARYDSYTTYHQDYGLVIITKL